MRSHEQEHTQKNWLWHELEDACQNQAQANHDMDEEIGDPLFHHFHWDLAHASTLNLDHLIVCQRNQMCQTADCCCYWERQAQKGANGVDNHTTHQHVQMVCRRFPEVVCS